MLRRWHLLLLILVTLTAFCGLAAAKLRATPKFDRVRVGMTSREVADILGEDVSLGNFMGVVPGERERVIEYEEGEATLRLVVDVDDPEFLTLQSWIIRKSIKRRGPLERVAWLAGWR